ncbi:ATP-dependent Clp protease adapter ClpS [Sulfurospirillum sp. T05]|uniref:ATP-dependent Clp protease adapter protein ClpS n=1 Tax=Sulfurospirillum tamanense TaxID=2813362 RepID=A0ABS2WQE6_9BACT|nr:ATP-dependent Clp protease adapter ClpS [Sulfurospirillum tamanensis]MBN2963911.1 ATP-dependent Clp protease adapter ClpS [Sulfurospirillum tamanensis]
MAFKEELDTDLWVEVTPPRLYKVLLLNDDFTSMDFVVRVLVELFHHSHEKALEVMLAIHEKGRGVCGVYTREIAETKVVQVHRLAKSNAFPLRAVMEEE